MAKTVNLGNVIGPKPELKYISVNKDITDVLDSKQRIHVITDPIVTGFKYLYFELSTKTRELTVKLYAPNTDIYVGELTSAVSPQDPDTTIFRCFIPTPFNYSLSIDNINVVRLVETGSYWE